MIVADISDEAARIVGRCKDAVFYQQITRAIEVLSCKDTPNGTPAFDPLLVYVEMNLLDGQYILTLPHEIEVPIKININKHPAFSRSKLYEFSLNGPGSDDAQFKVKWQWIDNCIVPIIGFLPSTGTTLKVVPAVSNFAGDDGVIVSIFGLDADGNEIHDDLTIDHANPPVTANQYRVIRRVRKGVSQGRIRLVDPNGNEYANYYPTEINPEYRQIKLSKTAAAIRMLARRKTFQVTGETDYIPLHSGMALLMMMRAIKKFSESEPGTAGFKEAQDLEDKANQWIQEKQATLDVAAAMASSQEDAPMLNLNINNRDSVIAADVYDDFAKIFGPVGREKLFDYMTEAVDLLNAKCPAWKGAEGYVDLFVGRGGRIVLPRYVDKPIKINLGRRPLQFRNRWFEFHLNGPGSDCHGHSFHHWDDRGESVTVNDPAKPFRLVAINDLQVDDGLTVTVTGYDSRGRRIRTPNPDIEDEDNPYIDGVRLVANKANVFPMGNCPVFSRIDRIIRDQTQGYQQLLAFDKNNDIILVGYFMPDETEPNYSVIELPKNFEVVAAGQTGQPNEFPQWARMRYRKRLLKVTSLTDQLHLRSRSAIVAMARAIKSGDLNAQNAAAEILKDEEAASNPPETFSFEFDPHTDMADPMQGQF